MWFRIRPLVPRRSQNYRINYLPTRTVSRCWNVVSAGAWKHCPWRIHAGPRQALEVVLAHGRGCHGRAILPADTTHEMSDQGSGKNLPDPWLGMSSPVPFDSLVAIVELE